MKRAKRILAMVLAVMMIAGMAPTQAWDVHAEETTDQSTEISSADQDATAADEMTAGTAEDGSQSEPAQQEDATASETDGADDAAVPQDNTASDDAQAPENADDATAQDDAAAEASENTAETYAVDPQAVTTAVYEQVDSIDYGEEYLIVYRTGNKSNSQYYALTVNGNSLSAQRVYPLGGEIDLTAEENNVLWTINQNNIQINGQILKAVEGYYNGYSASISSYGYGGYNFVVNGDDQIRANVSYGYYPDYRYLAYETGYGSGS